MKRVGYWMSEKKSKRLKFEDHKDFFRNADIDLIKIDIDKPLDGQGPFDLIVHKFAGVMAAAQDGDTVAQEQICRIQSYIARHPDCIIVDPLESITKIIDRYVQYNLLLQCNDLWQDACLFTPTFVELTSKDIETNMKKLKEANVTFPIVCKPIVAHGTNLSHEMSILFCEKNLVDVQPPCVAQTFINHNALLYKVYVIGDKQMIVERPSLKNFYAGDQETINFNSSDVSKPNCTNFLTELDSEDRGQAPIKPDVKLLEKLAQLIREECKLELFGFDVIIDCDTKKYAVIDVNAFPGYEGVDNFIELLRDHIKIKIKQKEEKSKSANKDETNRSILKHGRKLCENGDNKQSKRLKYSEKEFSAGSYHYEKCVNAAKCNSNLRDDATTTCQGDSSDSVISDAESQDTEDMLQWQQSVNGCGERSAK